MFRPDMLHAEPFRLFGRHIKMRLHSAPHGTSTDVEMRSRIVMRARSLCESTHRALLRKNVPSALSSRISRATMFGLNVGTAVLTRFVAVQKI